ncbi:MAG: sulfurtransferase [Pseudomonadota bacterium]
MSESLPHLIEPEQLGELPRPGVVVIHVAEAPAYAQAHLPGARLVEPRALMSGQPPAPGKLPDAARLQALFSALGYQPDQHLVVYDDEGGGWAGRFIWTLDVIGHARWSYLNGGIHAWQAAGGPVVDGPPPSPAPTAVRLDLDRAPVAGLEDVRRAIHDPKTVIWDARSPEEYRGAKTGSQRAGHIPTAVNLDWTALKDPDRQLRLVTDLAGVLAAHGITPDKHIITHCQSHHRSALTYLAARLLDYPRVRGYDGSWAEWGNRDDTPVALGDEPGAPAGTARD